MLVFFKEGKKVIREGIKDDISRIAEIHVCAWRHAYRGIISDEELFGKRLVSKSIENLKRDFDDGLKIFVYDDNNIIKGFVFHGKSRDKDKYKQESYEAYALYLQPEFMGVGIGSILMKAVEENAQSTGFRELMVWVLKKNSRGRNFYRKYGFEEDGKCQIIEKYKEFEIRMIYDLMK